MSQILIVLSKLPDAKCPLLIWHKVLTDLVCPSKVAMHLSSFQALIVLSSEPDIIYPLLNWHKHLIHFLCPNKVVLHLPSFISHILILRSAPPEHKQPSFKVINVNIPFK